MILRSEERGHVRRNDRSDVRHLLDGGLVSLHQTLEGAEMAGEREGRGLAHFPNAEPVEQARQRGATAALDGSDEIGGGLLPHPIELRELLRGQRIQIGRPADLYSLTTE